MYPVASKHPPGTIGIVSGDLSRYPGFFSSLMRLRVPEGSTYRWVRGTGIAENRNAVVRNMHGEWLWFIDDDHTFAPDTLMRLLDRNVDIVQALVVTRKPPYRPHVYRRQGQGFVSPSWSEIPTTGISEWDAASAGGLLIRRTVLEKVGDPWFQVGQIHPEQLSEDLHFCIRAKESGFTFYVDSDTRTGHCTTCEVWAEANNGQWTVELDMGHETRIGIQP